MRSSSGRSVGGSAATPTPTPAADSTAPAHPRGVPPAHGRVRVSSFDSGASYSDAEQSAAAHTILRALQRAQRSLGSGRGREDALDSLSRVLQEHRQLAQPRKCGGRGRGGGFGGESPTAEGDSDDAGNGADGVGRGGAGGGGDSGGGRGTPGGKGRRRRRHVHTNGIDSGGPGRGRGREPTRDRRGRDQSGGGKGKKGGAGARKSKADKLSERKQRILAMVPRGELHVDMGALHAIYRGRSLYPAGIVNVTGDFEAEDAVYIMSGDAAFAIGKSNFSASELLVLIQARERHSAYNASILGRDVTHAAAVSDRHLAVLHQVAYRKAFKPPRASTPGGAGDAGSSNGSAGGAGLLRVVRAGGASADDSGSGARDSDNPGGSSGTVQGEGDGERTMFLPVTLQREDGQQERVGFTDVDPSATLAQARVNITTDVENLPPAWRFVYRGMPMSRKQEGSRARLLSSFSDGVVIQADVTTVDAPAGVTVTPALPVPSPATMARAGDDLNPSGATAQVPPAPPLFTVPRPVAAPPMVPPGDGGPGTGVRYEQVGLEPGLGLLGDGGAGAGAGAGAGSVPRTTTGHVRARSAVNPASVHVRASTGLPEHLHPSNRIVMLFSEPLVCASASGALEPVPRIAYEREFDDLCRSLRDAGRDVELDFGYATTDSLRTKVTLGCGVMHYSGHGLHAGLGFENMGQLHLLPAADMGRLFAAGRTSSLPRLVFVSACHSRAAGEAFVDAGVQHVVAVEADTALPDPVAAAFTRAFYLALVTGHTVREAFDIGRENVEAAPNCTLPRRKFLLLPRSDPLLGSDSDGEGDVAPANDVHAVPIFPSLPALRDGQTWRPRQLLAVDDIPAAPEPFFGRWNVIYNLLRQVLAHRWVTVRGDVGMGTSSVARAMAQYVSRRRLLADGVHYVSLENCVTLEQVTSAISYKLLELPADHPMRLNPVVTGAASEHSLHASTSFPSLSDAASRSTSVQPRASHTRTSTVSGAGTGAGAGRGYPTGASLPQQHRSTSTGAVSHIRKVPSSPSLVSMGSPPRESHASGSEARSSGDTGSRPDGASLSPLSLPPPATHDAGAPGGSPEGGAHVAGTDGLTLVLRHAECMLVLDEVDNLLSAPTASRVLSHSSHESHASGGSGESVSSQQQRRRLCRLLNTLLERCPKLRIVTTASRSLVTGVGTTPSSDAVSSPTPAAGREVGVVGECVVNVPRLSDTNAAEIFLRRAGRSVTKQEVFANTPVTPTPSRAAALQLLAQHDAIKLLGGNPHKIILWARLLKEGVTLDALAARIRESQRRSSDVATRGDGGTRTTM